MAIENSDSGTMITGEHITMFMDLRIAAALALEINTGLKVGRGGSVMQHAAKKCGSSKRTKKGVLADYVAWMKATYPQYEASPSVVKAMGK
jgi:hypothetical protein